MQKINLWSNLICMIWSHFVQSFALNFPNLFDGSQSGVNMPIAFGRYSLCHFRVFWLSVSPKWDVGSYWWWFSICSCISLRVFVLIVFDYLQGDENIASFHRKSIAKQFFVMYALNMCYSTFTGFPGKVCLEKVNAVSGNVCVMPVGAKEQRCPMIRR